MWHLEGLHPPGVVFQAFSTIAFSSPCHWLSNAPPFGGGQLERVGRHHGFWVWPLFKFARPLAERNKPNAMPQMTPQQPLGSTKGPFMRGEFGNILK